MAEAGITIDWVQDNHSFSAAKGTLRGLHYQRPPHAQDKLVRCTRGAILDVAVDFREGSETFAKWVAVELSAGNGRQLLIPQGFLHGLHRWMPLDPGTDEGAALATALSHQVALAPGAGFAILPQGPALRVSLGGATTRDLEQALRIVSAVLPG